MGKRVHRNIWHHTIAVLLLGGYVFLAPIRGIAQTDSVVDCFPLAVGNQWRYLVDHYQWIDYNAAWSMETDSGSALCTILGKEEYPDSVLWTFKESRILHRWEVYRGPFPDTLVNDSLIIDSTTFVLVELKSGRHELFRQALTDEELFYETSVFWNSALPFQRGAPDTARVYRYYRVDSTLTSSFQISSDKYNVSMRGTMEQDSGLARLSVSCTVVLCFQNAHHRLQSVAVSGVFDDQQLVLPGSFSLEQNYPNPFNPSTVINYALPTRQHVTLEVFDVLGREIATLVNEVRPAGEYTVRWNAEGVPSGVYFYRMQAGAFTATKKVMVLR